MVAQWRDLRTVLYGRQQEPGNIPAGKWLPGDSDIMAKYIKTQKKSLKAEKAKRRLEWRSLLNALLAGMGAEVVVHPQFIPVLVGVAYLNNLYGGRK